MKKVLIAEEEPHLLTTLANQVEKAGYQVIGAIDGLQAIEFFKEEKPDLVVTSLLMPFATGLEFTNHIRLTEQDFTPIILLTAVGTEDMVMKSIALGINEYLNKPFIPNELMIRIERLIGQS